MKNELIITVTILSGVIGTFIGGVFCLIKNTKIIQRVGQILMMIGLGLGAIGAASSLLTNSDQIKISELVIDHLSAIFLFLINSIGFLSVLYGLRYLNNEKHHYNASYIQFLTAIFLVGMQMVVMANNTVLFLFAWEVMSVSSFLLVIGDFNSASIRPAIFYLIITHLGAGAIFAGFLLLSAGSLTMNFSEISQMIPQTSSFVLTISFLLFFFGFGSKSGLFPFHGWLPEAHPQAPSHISALMSGIMLKIAVYGFLRVILFILPVMPTGMGLFVLIIGLFSAVFGVLYSLIETDIKRILAFSSIENLGIIFSMIGIYMIAKSLNMDSLADIMLVTVLFQSICHAFFKSGLFLSAGVIGQIFHTRNIEKMGGMAKNMKLFSFSVLLLSLSAAALPPSGAFIGEWLFFQSLVTNLASTALVFKLAILLTFIVIGFVAGMAVFSMVRFFGMAFLAKSRTENVQIEKDPNRETLTPIIIIAISIFIFGAISPLILKVIGQTLVGQSIPSLLSFNPFILFVSIFIIISLAYVFRLIFSNKKNERVYHSWDCGQNIDSTMEYTATAFASPLRFFFNMILRANKKVESVAVVESNIWINKKKISIEIKPIWEKLLYNPIIAFVNFVSLRVRKLQNGNIQFYATLILLTLVITAIIAL